MPNGAFQPSNLFWMLPPNQPTLVRMPLARYKIDRALHSGVYDLLYLSTVGKTLSHVEAKEISRAKLLRTHKFEKCMKSSVVTRLTQPRHLFFQ